MSPLAQESMLDSLKPPKQRVLPDHLHMKIREAHCFEMTAVRNAMFDLAAREQGAIEDLAYLPAPVTWIEWKNSAGRRSGILAEEGSEAAKLTFIEHDADGLVATPWSVEVPLEREFGAGDTYWFRDVLDSDRDWAKSLSPYVHAQICAFYAALVLINSPRDVGRRSYAPHRGLERRLLAERPALGRFPAPAWTEIRLEVATPRDASGDPALETHLTGRKCYHFVRAHKRDIAGTWVKVVSHWRGDKSLGTKRSRYTVIPPRGGGPMELGLH